MVGNYGTAATYAGQYVVSYEITSNTVYVSNSYASEGDGWERYQSAATRRVAELARRALAEFAKLDEARRMHRLVLRENRWLVRETRAGTSAIRGPRLTIPVRYSGFCHRQRCAGRREAKSLHERATAA